MSRPGFYVFVESNNGDLSTKVCLGKNFLN